MIKAIFFDLGDVLIDNSFDRVLTEVAKNLNLQYEDIKQINNEYREKLMVGEMSIREISQIIKERFNLFLTAEEIHNIWGKSYKTVRVINEELYDVVDKLKERYVVGMISNIYDLMAKLDRERGILDVFDPCILSCEVGLQKPDKEIFELALKEGNLNAHDCVFVDNREGHLVSPKKMGFNTILFENNKKTIDRLTDLGIQI